ncbi:MAG: NAD-binding protein [Myxococcota bacterium]
MATILVVGDGPAGLSAALFLAKSGQEVKVFGRDDTPMHKAMLYNYLGVPETTGSRFQELARKQVLNQGAELIDATVEGAERTETGFAITTDRGERHEGRYLLLATGPKHVLAEQLGLDKDGKTIRSDENGRTSIERLYVSGWTTRPDKIQAIISAGDGAAAALDILSAEEGKDVHDFDVVG